MPSGDSISKYDTSRDLYSIQLSPIQLKKNLNPTLKTTSNLDSIGTAKDKNERVHLIKVTPKSMVAVGEQAVKIARAGRFIFYAIAMPPFFLFYTVPKWVTLILLPPLMIQFKKRFDNVEVLIKTIFKRINEAIALPFRNLLGKISWKNSKIEKQGHSFLGYLSQNFLKMREFVENRFKGIKNMWNQKAMIPLQPIREMIQKKVLEIVKESKKIFYQYSHRLIRYSEVVKKVYSEGVQPVLNMLVPYIQAIQKPVELALSWGREILNEKVIPVVRSGMEKSRKVASETLNKLNNTLTQMTHHVQPVINYFAITSTQFLKKHLSFGIQWLKNKPKEKCGKFVLAVRKYLGTISLHLNDVLDRSINYISWCLSPFYQLIMWFKRKLLSVFRVLWTFTKMFGLMFYKKFSRLLDPLKKKICRLYAFFIAELKAMMKAPMTYFWQLFKKLVNVFLQVLKICVLIIIAVVLVFKFWFKMMFELSESFIVKKPKLR